MLKRQLSHAVLTLFLLIASPWTMATEATPLTLKEAMLKAIEVTGGEVIKTEVAQQEGQAVYKIRLVKEGRVKDILIDSQSGEIINPGHGEISK